MKPIQNPTFGALAAVLLFLAIAPGLKLDTGRVDAAVTACACTYCGDVTYCAEMGHNIVPIGLPARNVKRLLLNKNNITAIYGGDFRGMDNLETLVLDNNNIQNVDADAFAGLGKLRSLHLEYNLIERLSEGTFRNLPLIKHLYLDHNRLASLPGDIPYLRQLEKLTLADNSITSVYWASFIQLDQIKSLTLWENPLRCDCNTQELKRWFATTSSGRAISDKTNASRCSRQETCTSPKILSIRHLREPGASPNNVYITNERAMLHCDVTGSPPPLVVWQTKTAGFVYPFKTGRIEAFANGTLSITKLAKSDMGTYACYAQLSGRVGGEMMKTVLFVTDGVKPQAEPRNDKMEAKAGQKVEIGCDVTGVPTPAISWQLFKDGERVEALNLTDERFTFLQDTSILRIAQVSEADGGEWRCTARNSQGSAQASVELVVHASANADVTVIIIGACAAAVFLVIVAVVTAIACTIHKRRRDRGNRMDAGASQSSKREAEQSELEWTREKKEKGTARREKKEKGRTDAKKKTQKDGKANNAQIKNGEKTGESNPAFLQSDLPQPYEYEPEVKGFRL